MPAPEFVCSPSFKIGVTEYDVTEATYVFDPDMQQEDSNASFFPAYTMGLIKANITIKTKDATLARTYFKGKEATDVELVLKRTPLTPGANPEEYTFAAGSILFKISNCRVTEGVPFGGTSDKKNSEFTIVFMAARVAATNVDPNITYTYTAPI